MATRRRFSDKFKAKVVALAREPGAKISDIARKNKLGYGVLRRWIQLAEAGEVASAGSGRDKGNENGAVPGLRGRKGGRSPAIAMQLRAEMARLEKQLESIRETLKYYG